MGCERARTETLLWIYGEASDDALDHILTCADCSAVVDDHAQVVSALGPSLAAVQGPGALARPARSAGRRWAVVGVPLLAAAAALLVSVVLRPPPSQETQGVALLQPMALDVEPWGVAMDPFDVAIEDLDRELDEFSRDLEML